MQPPTEHQVPPERGANKKRFGWKFLALAVVAATVILAGGYHWWRTKNISSVQRGWVIAENLGCFACHGPGGIRGMADPGYASGDVPSWDGGTVMMYAKNRQELYEWILDGMPARLRSNPAEVKERANAVIQMPAWRSKVSGRDLDDLVAFVAAVSRLEVPPNDSPAARGLAVADKFGCFNCHGPMGRGSSPNVQSFKGYIPSWDGDDFPDLVANDQEIRDWILDGGPKRILSHPIAKRFIARQPIKMPAYREHISAEEVDALTAYIHWLRGG